MTAADAVRRREATIREARPADAGAIARIYDHYVLDTVVTFEEAPVPADAMAARLVEVQALALPWLVAEAGDVVVGYAYATRWRARSAYRHSAETTVYLRDGLSGAGLGTALYSELLARLRVQGLHAAIGGIALPNAASVALHEKLGFEHVGTFRQVGRKHDRWIDVGYWQVLL